MSDIPFSFSHIPGSPSFRNSAVNAVAVVPLLSRNKDGDIDTKSVKSFHMLSAALGRHTSKSSSANNDNSTDYNKGLLVVVPNSSLTRPGDWRYNDTPLKGFHWQHGCQRLRFFDGRPQHTRLAHDRLMNHFTRDWIDLFPSRRTAAVIGVLNMHDCRDLSDLHRAEEELHQWANRYSTPPYEVTALGRSFERDNPVERLFVFDSFDEECQRIDLSKSNMENSILAFPPSEEEHSQMMDLHLNVVVNDLAVAIFRNLEARIVASDAICALSIAASQAQEPSTLTSSARLSLTRIMSGPAHETNATPSEEPVSAANRLSVSSMASIVSPDSKLAGVSPKSISTGGGNPTSSFAEKSSLAVSGVSGSSFLQLRSTSGGSSAAAAAAANASIQKANSSPKLITPLDAFWEKGGLSARDVDAIRRRDVARREKWAADTSLLAGSPLDAYERYVKAAEMCKSGTPDPLWYASALEGCAAAHIAMAEAGGFGVDEYLENNFQMPDEVMSLLTRDDARRQASSASSNKQTLPEIVFALCDEALNITNRHEKLGAFHSELLLKLALYVSESSEGHLRCRWGEGDGCYAGEVDDVPRWQKPSVAKLKFSDLNKPGLDNMIAINSFSRAKQVSELLHEAVSVGSLDPPTRVDVAACCVRLCLKGIKATQWKGVEVDRMRLPRKAAFFAVVAAEAMTDSKASGGDQTSRDLWLLATQLYSKSPNVPGKPGEYGWAGLRAITLNALSTQGNNPLSLKAAEQLLSLLSEITPPSPQLLVAGLPRESPRMTNQGPQHSGHGKTVQTSGHGGKSIQTSGHGIGSSPGRAIQTSGHGGIGIQTSGHGGKPSLVGSVDQGEVESVKSASAFARQLRESFTTLTAGSSILVLESRWANNDVTSFVDVPLALSSVEPMGCVWRTIDQEKCSTAQTRCLNMISKLHRSLPTGSGTFETSSAFLPIAVSSGMSIQVEQDLELERAKKEVKKDQGGSADPMATFFNPFANKRTSKAQAVVVAEGEARAMCVELSNRLSVPVTVIRCQLQFKNELDGRVKATPLSFTIPPEATGFPIHFPFCVLPLPGGSSGEAAISVFEVTGLKLTFAGRVFFLRISPGDFAAGQKSKKKPETREIPAPASLYRRLSSKVSTGGSDQDRVDSDVQRIESCPPQPRLQVCLAKSGAPLDAERPISICLAEGELYTLPTLRLKNYLGPSGLGKMEHLQIFAVDLPGLSDKKIYDSDVDMPADQDFAPQLGKEQPALKLRCLSSSLKLEEMNECHGSGSLVTCQIAASHLIQKQIPKGATIKLRFRYRGVPGTLNEFWRRREISLRVACVSGPRISSLDFRPDLLTGSAYLDMCRILRAQKNGKDVPGQADKGPVDESANPSFDDKKKTVDLLRVGMDKGIHVASSDVIFVLTVANETSSELIISKEDGDVGGFPLSPLRTLQVHSGVSAKFPVVIPRIPRSPASTARDLVKQVIALTCLRWEIEREEGDGDDPNYDCEMAKGHLHIPSACLEDIIEHHPSFVSRICEPPCRIELLVQGTNSSSFLSMQVGKAMEVSAEVSIASWVPALVVDKCRLVLEFLCARQGRRSSSPTVSRDFVWCGKTRQPFEMKKKTGDGGEDQDYTMMMMQHRIKLVFCASGIYAVSACARLQYETSKEEEIWLAPTAITVQVDRMQQQQQQ